MTETVVAETGKAEAGMAEAGRAEAVQEVLVTLLATLAFGLTWAAIEAGAANSALARDGIPALVRSRVDSEVVRPRRFEPPAAARARTEAATEAQTRYARVLLETR